MKIKIYRWLEYNKWLVLSGVLGLCVVVWITSCKPTTHTDVQMRTFTTDTLKTDTLKTDSVNEDKR